MKGNVSEGLMRKIVDALKNGGLPTTDAMVTQVAHSTLKMAMYQGNVPVSDKHINLAVELARNRNKK